MTEPAARKIDWSKFRRSVIGLVLGPIVGSAVAFVGLALSEGDIKNLPHAVELGGYFGATLGVPPALVIGYPLHAFLMSKRWTHPAVYAGVGVVLAGIGFALANWGLSLLSPWNS